MHVLCQTPDCSLARISRHLLLRLDLHRGGRDRRAAGPLLGGVIYQFIGLGGMYLVGTCAHSVSLLLALSLIYRVGGGKIACLYFQEALIGEPHAINWLSRDKCLC